MIKKNISLTDIIMSIFLISYSDLAFSLSAEEIVYDTTQEVLGRLEADKEKLESEPEHIQLIVRDIIVPHMDFTTMATIILGKRWEILSKDIQACFSFGLKNLLIERYAYSIKLP